MIDFLISMLKMSKIPFSENEPLAPKSTFRVGGQARIYITPQSIQQFASAVSALKNAEIPFFVTGGASNIVFPDGDGSQFNNKLIGLEIKIPAFKPNSF